MGARIESARAPLELRDWRLIKIKKVLLSPQFSHGGGKQLFSAATLLKLTILNLLVINLTISCVCFFTVPAE